MPCPGAPRAPRSDQGSARPATDPDSNALRVSRGWACIKRLPSSTTFANLYSRPANNASRGGGIAILQPRGSPLRFGVTGALGEIDALRRFFGAGTNDR